MANLQPAMPMKKLEIWACEWEDAHWDNNEYQQDQLIHRPVNYVSVGILLKDDETGMSLSTDLCEEGTFRGINFVPAKMILRRWKVGSLAPASPRKPRRSKARSRSAPIPPTSDTQLPEPK